MEAIYKIHILKIYIYFRPMFQHFNNRFYTGFSVFFYFPLLINENTYARALLLL